MRKSAYLLSVAAIAVAAPVFAQEAPAPQQGTAAADTATADEGGADIIVTATRRAERLSDVPIAVSAVSQQALQNSGATDIRALAQLAPSLLVSSTGSEANASARVRGIGTVGDNPGLESSVAVFIDGVYRSRTGSGLNDIGEVDRIEVLRGPQGTLFGRNASAGLINVITKAPAFEFGGYGEASYGNYNNIRVAGAVTGPITDTVAFRVDGVYGKRDGFYYDTVNKTDYNNRDRIFVRGQLLFQPSSDLSIRLIGDYTYRNEKCCGAVYVDLREKTDPTPGVPGDYAVSASNRIVDIMTSMGAVFPSANDLYNRRIANTVGRAYSNKTKDYGGSAQIDWNFGGASLTSITAYREYKAGGASDIDYGSLDIGYRPDDGNNYRQFHTFSQELRLNGSALGDKLDWLIGGYYSREDLQVVDNLKFGTQYGMFAACRVVSGVSPAAVLRNPNAPGCLSATGIATLNGALGAAAPLVIGNLNRLSTLNDLGTIRDVYNQRSENFAAFTHNIFKVTDRLSITLGARYTHEKKDFNASFQNNNTICPALQAGTAQGRPRRAADQSGARVDGSGHHHAWLHRQLDDRAQRQVDQRQPERRRVHRHRRRLVQAGRRADGLCELFARLQGGAATISTVRSRAGIPGVDHGHPECSAAPLRSRDRQFLRGRLQVQLAQVHPERRRLPAGVQQLPAQHLQRHQLHRPEYRIVQDQPERRGRRQQRGDRRLHRRREVRRALAGYRDRGGAVPGAQLRGEPGLYAWPPPSTATTWSAANRVRRSIRSSRCCRASRCRTRRATW